MVNLYSLKLFIIYIAVLIILFFSGKLLVKLFVNKPVYPNNYYLSILFNIYIALILISSLLAIIFTNGITFQWVILLSIISLFFSLKKQGRKVQIIETEEQQPPHPNLYTFFVLTTISIFSFFLIYFINGSPINQINIDLYYDLYLYAKLSSNLFEFGIENPMSLMSPYYDLNKTFLYHYSDLWFTGLIGKLTPLSETEILVFITYPALLFLSILGLIGVIIQRFKINAFVLIIFVLVLIYGTSIYTHLDNFALYKQAYFRFKGGLGLDWMLSKTLILFPSIILALFSLKQQQLVQFSFWMLISMAIYNTAIPTLTGGGLIVLLYYMIKILYKKQNHLKKELFFSIFLWSTFIVFLLGYIYFFTMDEGNPPFVEAPSLKSTMILFIEFLISPWLIYPFTLIILVREIFNKKLDDFQIQLLFFLIGTQLAGTIFVIINHHINNSTQALTNATPIVLLVFTVLIIKKNPTNKAGFFIFILILFVSSLQNIYLEKNQFMNDDKNKNHQFSTNFKETIFKEIGQNDRKVKWVTLNHSYISNFFHYSQAPGSFILNIKNADFPLDISPYFNDNFHEFSKIYWNQNFPLCNEVLNNINTTEQVVLNFIKRKKVSYIFIENQTKIPSIIANNLELVVTDENTGDSFYKLIY